MGEKDVANTVLENVEMNNYSTFRTSKADVENGIDCIKKKFDPFTERKVDNPTTDGDTLTHLLKACLGTGILSMPAAFRCSGLVPGIISTIVISFVCTYCAYILVKCAHALYYRTDTSQMSYADVAETAFRLGPKSLRGFARPLRIIVDVGLFATQFGICITFTVIVATNCKDVVDYYQGDSFIHIRLFIVSLLVPFILLTLIPDWKKLAPVSMIANILMLLCLITISYWLISNLVERDSIIPGHEFDWIGMNENKTMNVSWYSRYPQGFSITIFAIEAIGVVMPLENKMKNPKNFVGPFGVLSRGMFFVTIGYILIGALGYLYDPFSQASMITLEMPINSDDVLTRIMAQGVRILVALAVFFSFCLQFFVCLDIAWSWIQKYYTYNSTYANRIFRMLLVSTCVVFAFICPNILPLIGLIGACCLSILGLLVPVIIDSITHWDYETSNWRLMRTTKNVAIAIVAVFAFYFGTVDSLRDIQKHLINNDK